MTLGRTFQIVCIILAFGPISAVGQDSLRPGAAPPPLKVEKWLQAPPDFDGQWSELRGKVVVLEFWATWCAPCIQSIPHLNQLATEFRDQDVAFVTVSVDDEDRLKPFLAKQPIEGMIGIDTERKNWDSFGVGSIPHTVLIGRDGIVVGTTLPEHVTNSILKEVLAGGKPLLIPKEGVPSDLEWDQHLIGWEDGIIPAAYSIIKPIRTQTSGYWPRPGHLTFDGVPLEVLVEAAYQTDHFHLDWRMPKDDSRFRAAVKVPDDRKDQLLPYFRQTLNILFDMQERWEPQEHDVYTLRRIEGHTPPAQSHADKELAQMLRGKISLRRQPMKRLCDFLTNSLDSLVIDETGLDGLYDFDLPYQPGQREVTIQALLDLGLEAVKARRTIQILVVSPASAIATK